MGKISLGVTVLPLSKLYACVGSGLIAVLLYLWFNKTRAGSAVRSVVEDDEGARVCGVNVGGGYALSFSLGIGLTVASGVLLIEQNADAALNAADYVYVMHEGQIKAKGPPELPPLP